MIANDLLTLDAAAALLPEKPHAKTLRRWSVVGVRGVRLQTWYVGGRVVTSHAALWAFIEAVTAARRTVERVMPDRAALTVGADEARGRLSLKHGL